MDQTKNVIYQNLNDISNARMYLICLKAMKKEISETKSVFLQLSSQAMIGHMFMLVMKVMDQHKDAASFWYLYNSEKQLSNAIGSEINFLKVISKNLSIARDKTMAHTDKKYVYQQEAAWNKANISGIDLENLINTVYSALALLFEQKKGCDFDYSEFLKDEVEIETKRVVMAIHRMT